MSKLYTLHAIDEAYFSAWFAWERWIEPVFSMVEAVMVGRGLVYGGWARENDWVGPAGERRNWHFWLDYPDRLRDTVFGSLHPVSGSIPIFISGNAVFPEAVEHRVPQFSFLEHVHEYLAPLPQTKARKRGVWRELRNGHRVQGAQANYMQIRVPHS